MKLPNAAGSVFFACALLGGCGGTGDSVGANQNDASSEKISPRIKSSASDYQNVVQELYISYYGRPADPAGLAYWEGVLLADNAPTDLPSLNSAYSTNAAIKAVINSFGSSAESQALYGTGTPTQFVTAIYNNALGRAPDPSGLNYWVGLITAHTVTQAQAAIAIMAGAVAEPTTSSDEQLVSNRLTVANYFDAQLASQNAVAAYSGLTAGATARTMLSGVTATTNTTSAQAPVNAAIISLISVAPGYLTTIAGDGVVGYSGDNGPAISASLQSPWGAVIDASGNAYIADTFNNRIRRVSTSGVITTVAGTGAQGYSGDYGPATGAELNLPYNIALDASGNIYVADSGNNVIRVVSATTGIISTVAGTGAQGYAGDNGPALSASLYEPRSVAVDGNGVIYIVDWGNIRIRKVIDGVISTVAGNGSKGYSGDNGPATSAALNGPYGVTVDPSGNLYIADTFNYVVRKVDVFGQITTLAGTGTKGNSGDNGPATSANLGEPIQVAIDGAGSLYIGDNPNGVVRKVTANGVISTVVGNGTQGYAGDNEPVSYSELDTPNGVTVDRSGNLYIADSGNNRIRRVLGIASPKVQVPPNPNSGIITTIAGNGVQGFSGDNGPALNAEFNFPQTDTVDANGNIYVVDTNNNRVRKIATNGIITTIAGNGAAAYSGDGGPAVNAALNSPRAVAVDAMGNVYITDTNNMRIRKVASNGIITTVAGSGAEGGYLGDNGPATSANLMSPFGVAVDSYGNLYFSELFGERVRRVDANGIITTVAGNGVFGYTGDNGPAINATFKSPQGIAVDFDGNIYVADFSGPSIRKVATNGIITTVAGNGVEGDSNDGGAAIASALEPPTSVAVDAGGNIYIGGDNRIRKVSPDGVLTTFAGQAQYGYSGDNGPATSAYLNFASGVALDANGNLYIVDAGNNVIRKVQH